ncbi:MAG: ORF6N domain-containing protein [Chloroflexia bacterium]|nr:ORF6N domain-containing protein [Chloroflexia bacterium]
MSSTDELGNYQNIESRIYTIRGTQVMLDSDLAELYQVATRVLNQAVKRNMNRFPDAFRYQLSNDEYDQLRSLFVTLEKEKSLRSQFVTLQGMLESTEIPYLCFYRTMNAQVPKMLNHLKNKPNA